MQLNITNFYKPQGFISIGLIILLTLFMVGCFKEEPKLEFNSIVFNEEFLNNISGLNIEMIAPASGTAIERIEKLKELKFLNIPEDIMDDSILYHSKNDEDRLKYLKSALNDHSKNKIIWALRGGYGSARLINDLKKMPKPSKQVLLVGYSDITALHLFLSQHWQWKSIHGAVLNELLSNKDPKNFEKIADILSGKTKIAKLENLRPLNSIAENPPKISGLLTGGNLTMIETSIGTHWQIKTDNKIIFLEDVGEDGYKIDRVLNHLKQAGLFKKAKAIVFGDFSCSKEGTMEEVDFALNRFANEMNIPVYKTNEFGHGIINYPLIYNAQSDIQKTDEKIELIMHMNR